MEANQKGADGGAGGGPGPRRCGDDGAYLKPAPSVSKLNARSIDNPGNKVLVIFNHASAGENEADVCQPRGATTPQVIKDLARRTVLGRWVVVYAFCSPTDVGAYDDEYLEGEPKVVKRAKDIEFLMREYFDAGMAPEQVFLAGQAAGAWASLLIARRGRVR